MGFRITDLHETTYFSLDTVVVDSSTHSDESINSEINRQRSVFLNLLDVRIMRLDAVRLSTDELLASSCFSSKNPMSLADRSQEFEIAQERMPGKFSKERSRDYELSAML
jgi:hypothetical protein